MTSMLVRCCQADNITSPSVGTSLVPGGRSTRAALGDKQIMPSVERDRLRERERQARAQMSSQAAEREDAKTAAAMGGAPLFDAPVRINSFVSDSEHCLSNITPKKLQLVSH
ncbi:hypothetical protein B566_EDAN005536 [Ephemera danica]|nr:hypothetical protein B566_EDAN005536 [Ephemera danica]